MSSEGGFGRSGCGKAVVAFDGDGEVAEDIIVEGCKREAAVVLRVVRRSCGSVEWVRMGAISSISFLR